MYFFKSLNLQQLRGKGKFQSGCQPIQMVIILKLCIFDFNLVWPKVFLEVLDSRLFTFCQQVQVNISRTDNSQIHFSLLKFGQKCTLSEKSNILVLGHSLAQTVGNSFYYCNHKSTTRRLTLNSL